MKAEDPFFTELETYMLDLLRYGVLDERPSRLLPSTGVDWEKMMDIAATQGLLAWVWDGISKLPKENQPPRLSSINWGLSAQEIWDRYHVHERVLKQMLDVCAQNNIRLLLFKGIALSKFFPKPESRPSGDIDIYLFDDYSEGDELFAHTNVTRTNKRTGFDYHGVHIENHRIFLNTYTQLQVDAIKYLEGTLGDVRQTVDGYYIMSPMADIVYQVMHFIAHFDDASASLSLKYLVDLGVTLQKYKDKVEPFELQRVLLRLNIIKVFGLMLIMVEKVMGLKFECYHWSTIPSTDIKSAFSLIMSRPKEFLPLIERPFHNRVIFYYQRYRQLHNLFGYLPITRCHFILKILKELFSVSVRRLFHLSDNMSCRDALKCRSAHR